MGVTREQRYILFLFGTCTAEFSKRFAGKPLDIAISKSAFIELAQNAKLVSKKQRAFYKNIQDLERQKYFAYTKKSLMLTKKGLRLYQRILFDVQPCLRAIAVLGNTNNVFTKKAVTILKST